MDNFDTNDKNGSDGKKGGLFAYLRSVTESAIERRKAEASAPIFDIFAFTVAFLFARCHIAFGTYPLAIALIAVLPTRVWIAAVGGAIGSLTLGSAGVIYAMLCAIVVFLRIIVSGTEHTDDGEVQPLFSESLLLRMSSATIGGFVGGVYEILLNGFTLTSVIFGVGMVLIPPVLCFGLSGIFESDFTFRSIMHESTPIFSLKGKEQDEKYKIIFFQVSALLLSFLVGYSLRDYEFLGIDFSYIFVGVLTIFVSKRFGALRGAAVGFISALGLSSSYSVAFALAGILLGAVFKMGTAYALVGGGVAAGMWSAYSGGVSLFVGILPEYVIAAVLSLPILKRTQCEKCEGESVTLGTTARDMVGTMALSYRNKYTGALDGLEDSLSATSRIIRTEATRRTKPSLEEVVDVIKTVMSPHCENCPAYHACREVKQRSLPKNVEYMAATVCKNGKLEVRDLEAVADFCNMKSLICDEVNREYAQLYRDKFVTFKRESTADDLEIMCKLINEARADDAREKAINEELCEKVLTSLENAGIFDATVSVLGVRNLRVFLAMEDKTGGKITSPKIKEAIASATDTHFGAPEYFRKDDMVLMECAATPKLKASSATAGKCGKREEISGDSVACFESGDGHYYALISDGMGSGEEAKEASGFVTDFLSRALDGASQKVTMLKLLNHLIMRRSKETSATVDLFGLDLVSGEAMFLKCGAVSSYIKRGASIFRIRSRTAPLGLMKELDAEHIKVDVQADDYVIMLSDGVCQTDSENPWLIEALSRPPKKNLKEYADYLMSVAVKNCSPNDDMTVIVTRIGTQG